MDVCPLDYPCCSKYGYCGNTAEHCKIKHGCVFGCWDSSSTAISVATPSKKSISVDPASSRPTSTSIEGEKKSPSNKQIDANEKRPVVSRRVFQGCLTPYTISLTFDDGPSVFTDGILDILRDYGIKGTFFVIGSNINTSSARATIKRIVAEGHVLGSHTWSHPDLTTLSDSEIVDEMEKTSDAIFASTGAV